jgi:hypothetical protein
MKFHAIIQGGEGLDVWDTEIQIDAEDMADASAQAVARANELGGTVTMIAAL